MKRRDIRLGESVALTGVVHTISAMKGNEVLPVTQMMVTILVDFDPETHVEGSER